MKYKIKETKTHFILTPKKSKELETHHLAGGHIVHVMQGPLIINKKAKLKNR